jgi:hypothetical protein
VLEGHFKDGDTVIVEEVGGRLVFHRKEKHAEPAEQELAHV